MQSLALDEFMTLNEQLAALLQAGIEMELGLAGTPTQVTAALQEINANVARRVSQGASLREALAAEGSLIPPAYQSLMRLALDGEGIPATLESHRRVRMSMNQSWNSLQFALLYPIVVAFIAYLGTISLCFYFVPTIESLYASLQLQPGIGLRAVQTVRDTLPFWVALAPLGLLVYLAWCWRPRAYFQSSPFSTARLFRWLPGIAAATRLERLALFARTTGAMLEHQASLAESIRLAAAGAGSGDLQSAVEDVAANLERGVMPDERSGAALRFPPFLRWAIWQSEPTTGRAAALRMVASVYQASAERKLRQWQSAAPVVACVVIGGVVVLLYCLALFLPLVELLRQLGSPT